MNITEDKLKAGIQIALGTLGLYTQEAETLLIHHIKALTLTDVSNSVICCPQCGNERLESTGSGWYICCDKDCDWGDKL